MNPIISPFKGLIFLMNIIFIIKYYMLIKIIILLLAYFKIML